MAKRRLKLARLTQREGLLLRTMASDGDFRWTSAEEMAIWNHRGPGRLGYDTSPEEVAGMAQELDALTARHFIDKNEQDQYCENQYGAWTEMVWRYHFGGTLIGTAKKVFGIAKPKLIPGAAIMYEVSEADLGRVFHIVGDDEAHQEYLEELKARNESPDDE